MTIPQAFQIALQHHQAARLADAERLCRQILAAQPTHIDALHLLGHIAHQTGRHDLAIGFIRQAIALHPNNPAAWFRLGEACRLSGRPADSIAAFRRVLQLQPGHVDAQNNLGAALAEQGRLDESVAAFRRALEIKSDSIEAMNNLGNALRELGQVNEAIAVFRRALQLQPGIPQLHNNLGNALRERGLLDEAIASCRRAIALKSDYPHAHNNLGTALAEQGKSDEAILAYHAALRLDPDYAEAHNNLGIALAEQGRFDEAVTSYRRALALEPRHVKAHNNLGIALADLRRFDEAIATYRRALEIQPDFAETYNNLGAALARQRRLDEAVPAYRHALALQPGQVHALNNLAGALRDLGQMDEAIATYRRALELKPRDPEPRTVSAGEPQNPVHPIEPTDSPPSPLARHQASVHSNLIYILHFHPDHDDTTIAQERHRWNRRFAAPLRQSIPHHAHNRDPERPLRVGYVSPDFREHVVGANLIPLFRNHDRQNIELFGYSGVLRPDKMTDTFRQCAHHWRNTVGVEDRAMAAMIRQDEIDILVDLTQHMERNRLPVFARKPAPIQASFAGYPESTGLEAIEYRISDRYLEGASADESGPSTGADLPEAGSVHPTHTHEISASHGHVFLIDSFWCYDPLGVELQVNPLPALETGFVTFGCLHNFCKINDRVLRLWARVLETVKHSRLFLRTPIGSQQERTLEILRQQGIESLRVQFLDSLPRREYLEHYHKLDILLDTFPYNGHTTSLDALWMGVPVVTLPGATRVSRAGLSQLSNLGLRELVAHSEDDYVRIAAELARNLPRLAQLRATLRPRMEASPLMDAPHFAKNIEAAYRSMWQDWVTSNPSIRQ